MSFLLLVQADAGNVSVANLFSVTAQLATADALVSAGTVSVADLFGVTAQLATADASVGTVSVADLFSVTAQLATADATTTTPQFLFFGGAALGSYRKRAPTLRDELASQALRTASPPVIEPVFDYVTQLARQQRRSNDVLVNLTTALQQNTQNKIREKQKKAVTMLLLSL